MTRRHGAGGGVAWPRVELGKAADIRGGATPRRNNPTYWDGDIPWLTPTDLPAEISRSLGMPQSTLKRYMALLEMTFLVQFLPPWSGHLGKRLVKSPKLYLNDTGLAAALLGQGDEQALRTSGLLGPLLENFVVAELFKQVTWSATEPSLYHFRTLAGQEVDVVLESPSGQLAGIEVKAGASVSAGDFKGLRLLAEETGKRFRCGVVLYQGRKTVPFGDSFHAVPIEALWRT